jgi:hypothetical protein
MMESGKKRKKRSSVSPTMRTLEFLRARGYMTGIVERYVSAPHLPGGGKRIDLFGTTDIIAIKRRRLWAIQSCGLAFSDHHQKLYVEKNLEVCAWLDAGGRFALIGWRKLKVRLKSGKYGKAMRWTPRIREYFLRGGELRFRDIK